MSKWECDKCHRTVVGMGGAIGLRAIGWYVGDPFDKGGFHSSVTVLCPSCRIDTIPCTDTIENFGKPCGFCKATAEAEFFQAQIKSLVEAAGEWHPPAAEDIPLIGDILKAFKQ